MVNIREPEADELPFLKDMLFTAATWQPRPGLPPKELLLKDPQLARYHEGWGREGDVAYVAVDDGQLVGAVFYRLFTDDDHGHGFVDERTPELAIGVVETHRGRGIGRVLMETIGDRARTDGLEKIALSVDPENPAKRLYTALGYKDFEPGDEHHRMVLELS